MWGNLTQTVSICGRPHLDLLLGTPPLILGFFFRQHLDLLLGTLPLILFLGTPPLILGFFF